MSPKNVSVDGNSSTPLCRDDPEPTNSQSLRLQAVLSDHVKIGPVAGIEVCKSAGIFMIEIQVPSKQLVNSKSWVRVPRGSEHYARQFIPTGTDHPNSGAVFSLQLSSCGRPLAQTQRYQFRRGLSLGSTIKVLFFSLHSERSIGQDQIMKQEWYCTSNAIDHDCISCFWYFIKVAVTRFSLRDKMPASALDKVVTFTGEILFKKKETPI